MRVSRLLRSFVQVCCVALLLGGAAPARGASSPAAQEQLNSGQILHRIQKLGVVGSVLYIAAHPDDENTRLISYLSNGKKVRTAYLSLTRGDGGQNLIGPELGPGLGVIRTQELLEARRIDGGEQFFSRAVDFGYSKSAEEALAKWGKGEVLSDVVRVVRTFRPDVIVTRFDRDGSGGHGHHTASSMLAKEAFEIAADPEAFPEHDLPPWQPRRLFFNGSTWWRLDLQEYAAEHPDEWVAVDVGGYDPLLGMSYNEIAGRARSAHRSQGFGSALRRGAQNEYLRFDGGEALATPDLFDGMDLTWGRIPGGAEIGSAIEALEASFDPVAPEKSFLELAAVRQMMLDRIDASSGQADPWIRFSLIEVEDLLLQLTGTVVDLRTPRATFASGEEVRMVARLIQRRPGSFFDRALLFASGVPVPKELDRSEGWNRPAEIEASFEALPIHPIHQPYWLARPFGTLYDPEGTGYLGIEPETASYWRGGFAFSGGDLGKQLDAIGPLQHVWVERVLGERSRPAALTPIASLRPLDTVMVVAGDRVSVEVEIEALASVIDGSLGVEAPEGWRVATEPYPVEGLAKGSRARYAFEIERSPAASVGAARFVFTSDEQRVDTTMNVIDYSHITPQVWYSPAEVRLAPVNVDVSVARVGYVNGAGDDVPRALRRLGIEVDLIDPAAAEPEELARFDAIMVGIRAYNAVPEMARLQPYLMDYVAAGGTVVAQYNTASRDMVIDPSRIGPKPFALTRGRVTVEEAPATFLLPEHPLLNVPNRLTQADFDGWVQERGLYFASDLDEAYSAPIAWNDPGESPLSGALIACDHGEGRFIYTGISLFRQLPAGVPGAYRLLANLLARREAR